MGCDIHIRIEVQETGGKWREIPWRSTAHCGPEAIGEPMPRIFDDRDYQLFGCLADVRREGDPYAIAPSRGEPPDAARPYDACDTDDYGTAQDSGHSKEMGDHSFTWVGLDELERYPFSERLMVEWAQPVLMRLREIAQGRPLRLLLGFDS